MYSTKEDFLKRVSEDDLNSLTDKEDDNLEEAINTADSIIDGYLSNIFSELPLDDTPKIITQISIDIALYNLHSRLQYKDIPDHISKKYEGSIKLLEKIASGEIKISIEDEPKQGKIIISSSPRREYR
ncbi:MAG: DUF1320 domain-containing protein [Ignavibacteria bacterium]|nr:DUF1320 domain-containing protein [Ignavibacteria bacterium]